MAVVNGDRMRFVAANTSHVVPDHLIQRHLGVSLKRNDSWADPQPAPTFYMRERRTPRPLFKIERGLVASRDDGIQRTLF